ncbi:MAG: YeeE/YedE family protein [Myxococcales bacterium]|nr:YeeE/YedE family protein [Myxococcales bacterium]
MKSTLAGFGSGALFGLGLIVAGMTKPEKVIGFLDFTGSWDPSLMFVMGGAVMVHFILFRVVRRLPTPVFDTKFHIPTRRDLDARLLVGAALFGIGWGLGGFCPGPGLVSLASGSLAPIVFVLAMTAGMLVQRTWDSIRLRKTEGATEPAPTLTVERPS